MAFVFGNIKFTLGTDVSFLLLSILFGTTIFLRATIVSLTAVDNVRQEKEDPKRVRITVDGDIFDYFIETSTETISLETAKILINSVLSTKNAKFMVNDLSHFYIQNDLGENQYIHFNIYMIPQDIIDEYNLTSIVEEDGWLYAETRKYMYGLKEIGYLLNVELKHVLAKEGYIPTQSTPGLFKITARDIAFSHVVDDFGVKYTKKEDAKHFIIKTVMSRYDGKASWDPSFHVDIIVTMRK